jgi:glutathione S-transferase
LLLASIAAGDAGGDGNHRLLQPHAVIERYLAEARRHRSLLLLDIQPGRADFAGLDRWLREPDVGLALDPEWHGGPTEIPGQVIGSVDAQTVNEVAAHLSRIVERKWLAGEICSWSTSSDET